MFVGKRGVFYGFPHSKGVALQIRDILEGLRCSHAYWSYTRWEMEKVRPFSSIPRGYPLAVVVDLRDCFDDADSESFQWAEYSFSSGPPLNSAKPLVQVFPE